MVYTVTVLMERETHGLRLSISVFFGVGGITALIQRRTSGYHASALRYCLGGMICTTAKVGVVPILPPTGI